MKTLYEVLLPDNSFSFNPWSFRMAVTKHDGYRHVMINKQEYILEPDVKYIIEIEEDVVTFKEVDND